MNKILLIALLLLSSILGFAQIEYVNSPPFIADSMAQRLAGKGVEVFNANLICPDDASGFFWNGRTTNLGMESGIVLTTGSTEIAFSPNTVGSAGFNNGGPGYAPLEGFPWAYYGGTFNACVLEFDFIPYGNAIHLNYIFGSEEYPEYVGSMFNDIFAILIEGEPEYPYELPIPERNIAIIPTSPGIHVAINFLNFASYNEWYQDNSGDEYIQYDGQTKLLPAKAKVTPCNTYHLVLVVADNSDGIYDSGLFFEENSFSSNTLHIESVASNLDENSHTIKESCSEGVVTFLMDFVHQEGEVWSFTTPSSQQLFGIVLGGTATLFEDYELDKSQLVFPSTEEEILFPTENLQQVTITPIADGIEEETEYITIGIFSGCSQQYLSLDTIWIEDDWKPAIIEDIGICEAETAVPLWASGGDDYLWFPEDYLSCTDCPNPTATVPHSMTYFVNIENSGCVEQKSVNISIAENLESATLGEEIFVCAGKAVILQASGGLSYEWEGLGDASIDYLSCTDCPNPIFSAPTSMGDYEYAVRISSGEVDCEKVLTTQIHVEQVELSLSANRTFLCNGATVILTAEGNASSYVWKNSLGEIIDVAASIEVSPETNETYTVIAQGTLCSISKSIDIEVCLLEAVIEASSLLICQGESVTLTAIGEGEHTWLDNDNNILGTGSEITFSPNVNTTYHLSTLQNGFTAINSIVIAVEPEISIQILPIKPVLCDGEESVRLEIVSPIAGFVYEWEEEEDLEVMDEGGFFASASPGSDKTFRVKTVSPAGCVLWEEVTVEVGGDELQLSVNVPRVICVDLNDPPVYTIQAYGADYYTWEPFGSIIANPGASEAVFIPNPANNDVVFTVTGMNEAGTCMGSLDFQIEVIHAPEGFVEVEVSGFCEDETTMMEAVVEGGSGNFEYQWSPVTGLSHPNEASTSVMKGEKAPVYTLTVRDIDAGCEITELVAFLISDIRVLSPTFYRLCEVETEVTFSVDGGFGATYEWTDPQGNILEETNGDLTTISSQTGIYTVNIATQHGCQKSVDFEVEVFPSIDIEVVDAPEMVCSGEAFVMELAGLNNYTLKATNNVPFEHHFLSPNRVEIVTYDDLELQISGTNPFACETQTHLSILISRVDVLSPFEVYFCEEEDIVSLEVDGGEGASYQWQPDVNISSTTASSVEISASSVTCYTVDVTTAEGCEETVAFKISPKEIPELSVSPDFAEICRGDTVRLQLSGAVDFEFFEVNEKPFEIHYLSANEVEIITEEDLDLIIIGTDDFGCQNEIAVKIDVNHTADEITVSEWNTICFGESIQLLADAGEGASYQWTPADYLDNPNIANPIASPPMTTMYVVEIISLNGCVSKHQTLVVVSEEVTTNLTATPNIVCADSETAVVLQGDYHTNSSYVFYDENGEVIAENSTGQKIVVPNTTTTYTLVVTNEDGCTAMSEATISVEDLQIDLPEQFIACKDEALTLHPSINLANIHYEWTPNVEIDNPNSANPTVGLTESRTYTLIVTTDAGCTDMIEANIEVTNDCVFPGDADNSGEVDMFDLFPLGRSFGKEGLARNSISNEWQGFGAFDWSETQGNGQNLKYVDCNGNGSIGFEDMTAIVLNFNLMQKSGGFTKGDLDDPELRFIPNSEAVGLGEWLELEVWIGSDIYPVSDLYAIAFETHFDTNLIDGSSISMDYDGSHLGELGVNLLATDWVNEVNGRINASLSKTGGEGASGTVYLLTIRMKSQMDILTAENFTFHITDFGATNSGGDELFVNVDETPNISIDPDIVNIEEENLLSSKPYQLYPTFTQNGFYLDYQIQKDLSIEAKLFSLSGQQVEILLQQTESSLGSFRRYIDLKEMGLHSGVYIVELQLDGVIYREKVIVF